MGRRKCFCPVTQLLKDIHTAQAEYRTAFEYDRWQAECREAVNQVLEVVSTCRTIMGNLEAGLRFYIQVRCPRRHSAEDSI